MAAIKAFLNSSTIEPNTNPQITWNARKQLALNSFEGFDVDLSNVVSVLETEIFRNARADVHSHAHTMTLKDLDIKVILVTEIEAATSNFLFGKPEAKLDTLMMKQLWSLIVQCFESTINFDQFARKKLNVDVWLQLKETLHTFEWMRKQLDNLPEEKNYEGELLNVWSIAWFKLKILLQKSQAKQNSHEIKELSQLLEPQLKQFNFIVRQFWANIGFLKVSWKASST